jgi:hypothetical protein
MTDSQLRDQIAAKSGVQLGPANETGIEQLRVFKVPDDAIAFYREAEPSRYAEIEKIRLWPIQQVVEENTDYVPGCYARPHGYVVFATTVFGDTYCFDLNNAKSLGSTPIVLLSHEMIGDQTTKEEVTRLAKKIAPDFRSFFEAFVAGNLDITPNHGPEQR